MKRLRDISIVQISLCVIFALVMGVAIGSTIYGQFVQSEVQKAWTAQEQQNEKVFQSKMNVLYGTKPMEEKNEI